jgi:hypothetical protein
MFSPFFGSQERMTQNRLQDGRLARCCDRPLGDTPASFGWTAGPDLELGAVVYRSYDGGAFLAYVGPPGCASWGNGWVPCTHLFQPPQDVHVGTGRIVFHVGTLEELRSYLKCR